jgi:hypothetical protein
VRSGIQIDHPQGDAGEVAVHEHEHRGRRAGQGDREFPLAAVETPHGCVDLGMSAALGQRHHPYLRKSRRLAAGLHELGRPMKLQDVHLIPSDFWREVIVDVAAYEVLLQNVLEGDLLRPQRRVLTVG